MTKQISITLDEELLEYLDDLAELNSRSRSSMLAWLITMCMHEGNMQNEEE